MPTIPLSAAEFADGDWARWKWREIAREHGGSRVRVTGKLQRFQVVAGHINADPESARDKLSSRYLAVEGKVIEQTDRKSLGDRMVKVVTLEAPGATTVTCEFDEEEREQYASLRNGDTIKLVGMCKPDPDNRTIAFIACLFARDD